jgi:hypothetical protein
MQAYRQVPNILAVLRQFSIAARLHLHEFSDTPGRNAACVSKGELAGPIYPDGTKDTPDE